MPDAETIARFAYGYALDLATADEDYPAEDACDMRIMGGWCPLPVSHDEPCGVTL
jgi:hypothetical protein